MSSLLCSEASQARGEPLAGTAVAEVDHWVLLEHAGPWGPKGLTDSGLDSRAVACLEALAERQPRVRVQLIRRPNRQSSPPTLLLARSGTVSELVSLALPGSEAVAQLPWDAWLSGQPVPGAQRLEEAIYLVCVHGKRDRCCAQRGMPVYSALAERVGDRVWQTTHLGGHRFAATLLVVPEGICYGRFAAEDVPELVRAHASGRLFDLAHLRGRCAYRASVQAAEVFLRRRLGEQGLRALRFVRVEASPEGERIVFRRFLDGSEHAVVVARRELGLVLQSCCAEPKPAVALSEGPAT